MKPEQPGPENYRPKSSFPVQFHFKWKSVRLDPQNFGADYPFRLELEQNRHSVRFLEFRSLCDPLPDVGNPGDIWLNVSPDSYALSALNEKREWVRWPGPACDKTLMVHHPYLPVYTLCWYHRDKLQSDWTDEKLAARQALGGYSSAESLLDPGVGVRLILLGEEIEKINLVDTPTEISSVEEQLKSAPGDMASALPGMQVALVATLTAGIDYLLNERKKLCHALLEAEERAAIAEGKLAETQKQSNSNYYREHCYTPTPNETPAPQTPSSSTNALSPQSSPTYPLRPDSKPNQETKSIELESDFMESAAHPCIAAKHLDLLFQSAEEGRSKNCRICLAFVAYEPGDELSALLSHALENHPDECAIFAATSDEELEVARLSLTEAG
ncbi:hypothetical protein C8F04DRAFT_1086496 [Mycena alexandri]|uniref:Uncharacterized protein n=1 Tax=Mycena alexandri TaxID=1745969 RepID=A0AAD6X7B9_9AGAR|nr:hypothetical protein C8F04DRAFT_1086496 [Mycena alexandri]